MPFGGKRDCRFEDRSRTSFTCFSQEAARDFDPDSRPRRRGLRLRSVRLRLHLAPRCPGRLGEQPRYLRLLPRNRGPRRQPPGHRQAAPRRASIRPERQARRGRRRPPGPPESPRHRPAPRPHRVQRVPRGAEEPAARHQPAGEPGPVRGARTGAGRRADLRAPQPGLRGRLLPRQLRLQRREGKGASVVWNGGVVGCGACHDLPPAGHPPLAGSVTPAACSQCHPYHRQRGRQHQRHLRRAHQRPCGSRLQLHLLPRHGGSGRIPGGHRPQPGLGAAGRAHRSSHPRGGGPPAAPEPGRPGIRARSAPLRRVPRRAHHTCTRHDASRQQGGVRHAGDQPRARPRPGSPRPPAARPHTATETSPSTASPARTPRRSGPTRRRPASRATACRRPATRPSPTRWRPPAAPAIRPP